MAIASGPSEPHWNYLLALDADLAQLARYVEFHADNFDCFSMEIARVLLSASAEVDVVAKQLCKLLDPTSRARTINPYRDRIQAALPQVSDFRVVLPRHGLSLVPWEEWSKADGIPLWWTAHNRVKHQRHTHFSQASLKHALNAVGGLLVLLLYLLKDKANNGELGPTPEVIRAGDDYIFGMHAGDPDRRMVYKL